MREKTFFFCLPFYFLCIQEEKEKKALELKSIRVLEYATALLYFITIMLLRLILVVNNFAELPCRKYKIQDNMYSLLQSSGNMGQVCSVKIALWSLGYIWV